MEYKRRCRPDPIPQAFPVLLILALVAIFLAIKRFLSSLELLVVEAPVVSLVCSSGSSAASVTAGNTTAIARGEG
ncbi:hypothetical protein C3L33_19877, partial [Rhododendron williamsianum]